MDCKKFKFIIRITKRVNVGQPKLLIQPICIRKCVVHSLHSMLKGPILNTDYLCVLILTTLLITYQYFDESFLFLFPLPCVGRVTSSVWSDLYAKQYGATSSSYSQQLNHCSNIRMTQHQMIRQPSGLQGCLS